MQPWLSAIRNDLQLDDDLTVMDRRRSASYWNLKLLAAVALLSAALAFGQPDHTGAVDLSICGPPIGGPQAVGSAVESAYVEDRIAAAAVRVVANDLHEQ
jgi:hypothetical protein